MTKSKGTPQHNKRVSRLTGRSIRTGRPEVEIKITVRGFYYKGTKFNKTNDNWKGWREVWKNY